MAFGLATELKEDRIAVVAVSPGWMRTELVLAHHKADEENWRESGELERTESPYYIGRAVSALAGDPHAFQKTGQVLQVGRLAEEYGFTDIDGRVVPPSLFSMPMEQNASGLSWPQGVSLSFSARDNPWRALFF